MPANNLFDLSTAVIQPDTFTVDGTQYELLGVAHLTPEDEVTTTALFARYNNLTRSMNESGTQAKAELFARQAREVRLKLLTIMTSCPIDVIRKLPMHAQITLMEAFGESLEREDISDESDDA